MDSNWLALNCDKMQIMIISKHNQTKENFSVTMEGKEIHHSRSVKILGTTLDENLLWDKHVTRDIIPSLKNCLRTLNLTTRCGGGVKKSLLSSVQSLQDRTAKIALNGVENSNRMSNAQRHTALGWLSIQRELEHAVMHMVHKNNQHFHPSESCRALALKQDISQSSSPQKTCSQTYNFKFYKFI